MFGSVHKHAIFNDYLHAKVADWLHGRLGRSACFREGIKGATLNSHMRDQVSHCSIPFLNFTTASCLDTACSWTPVSRRVTQGNHASGGSPGQRRISFYEELSEASGCAMKMCVCMRRSAPLPAQRCASPSPGRSPLGTFAWPRWRNQHRGCPRGHDASIAQVDA